MADIKSILYLESNKITYYLPGMEHPIALALPTAGSAYMEVLDKELIYSQIQTFAVSNKLSPCVCTIVLSNEVTFQKVIRQTQQTQKSEMVQDFLNNVPFDNVANISYDSGDTTYIFATNEELFTTVRRGFEKISFVVDAVIPVALIANANIPIGTPLTAQSASFLIENADAVKQFNFINVQQEIAQKAAKKGNSKAAKKDKKNEKILGGVFAALLMVLVAVYLSTNNSVAPAAPQAAAPAAETIQTEQAPAAPQADPNITRTDGKDKIAIRLVSSQATTVKADQVESALVQAGFTNVENETASSAASSISFSDTTGEVFKNELLTILRPILTDFTLLTHTGSASNVILNIGL